MTFADPTPRWSVFRNSPEHRPYNSLPRANQDVTITYPSLLPHRVNSKNDTTNAIPTSPLSISRRIAKRRTQSEDIYEDRVPPTSPRLTINERLARANPLMMLASEKKEIRLSRSRNTSESENNEKEDEEDQSKGIYSQYW